jgi:hypothetical protein
MGAERKKILFNVGTGEHDAHFTKKKKHRQGPQGTGAEARRGGGGKEAVAPDKNEY